MLFNTLVLILVISGYGGNYATEGSLTSLPNALVAETTQPGSADTLGNQVMSASPDTKTKLDASNNKTDLGSPEDKTEVNSPDEKTEINSPKNKTGISSSEDKIEIAPPIEVTSDNARPVGLLQRMATEALRTKPIEELLPWTETSNTLYQPIYTDWKGQTCTAERFKLLSRVGKGASGDVYRAQDNDGTIVAIKFVPKLKSHGIRTEEVFLSRLHHYSIANLHCVFPRSNYIALVMPLIDGVNLATRLNQGIIDDDLRKHIMRQLVDVLGYLHSQKVWHRDIKPENFMLTNDGHLYLIDFDLATINGRRKDRVGSPFYIAPEVWDGASPTDASDWFAAGIVFYELLNGFHPFNHIKSFGCIDDLAEAFKSGIPETGDDHDNELIQGLTSSNVEKRWGYANLETIKNHRAIKV